MAERSATVVAPRPGRRPERHRPATARRLAGAARARVIRWRRDLTVRRLWVTLIVAVALVALIAWTLVGSPWLRVHRINVVGADRANGGQIRAIAERQLGQPLLQVDRSAIVVELAELPPVAHADVTRDWPDSLTVSVAMRTPVVALRNAQGVLELVDADGVAFARADGAVRGLPTGTIEHPDEGRARAAAAGAMGALDAGQRSHVTSVTVQSPDDVRFVIDQVTVRWGGPEDGRQKAVVMAALLQQKGVRTINVSAPGSPVAS